MSFSIADCVIPVVKLISFDRLHDSRGFFEVQYSAHAFAALGLDAVFVQDNRSFSTRAGTLRGLHFQTPPFAQAKLVRVLKGRILDVAVDLRRSSATYGRHVAVELGADDGLQIFIPVGFAHGFSSLEPDTDVSYKVTNPYEPAHDRGLAYDDPALGIDWRLPASGAVLSEKDCGHPRLTDLPACFD